MNSVIKTQVQTGPAGLNHLPVGDELGGCGMAFKILLGFRTVLRAAKSVGIEKGVHGYYYAEPVQGAARLSRRRALDAIDCGKIT